MYYFFTEQQKKEYQQEVDDIEYAYFESRFAFVAVKNNLFILPKEVDTKIEIKDIELREIKESDKMQFEFKPKQ